MKVFIHGRTCKYCFHNSFFWTHNKHFVHYVLRRLSLKYPPLARRQGQNPRNQDNLVNKQVQTKLAQKNCEDSSCIRLTIKDILPNRKWVWQDRGSLVATDIFVRVLIERHTNPWLLPLDQSPKSSSVKHGRGMSRRPTYLFLLFFLWIITGSFIYMRGRDLVLMINEQTHEFDK